MKNSAIYKECDVYYDHGDTTVDVNVVATKAFIGSAVTNLNRLADVDVMVVAPNGCVRLLVEIEECASSPKKLLGDVLAVLICNRFAVRINGRQRYFSVSDETKLIIAGIVPTAGSRLRKIKTVILPRIRQLTGLADGVSPANVDLVFSASIQSTVSELQLMIERSFPIEA